MKSSLMILFASCFFSLGINAIATNNASINDSIVGTPSSDSFTYKDFDLYYESINVAVKPEFPGGNAALLSFIENNLKYSESESGRVTLSFIIEKDGSISDIEILRSPSSVLSIEAIRLVNSMPKWNPGKLEAEGLPVRVKYILPVVFKSKEKNLKENINDTDKSEAVADNITQPEFPGGETSLMKFISRNLKYPEYAAKNRIQGQVLLVFIVGKDGFISNIEIHSSPSLILTDEAVRVVRKMPKWKPGKKDGQPVDVKFMLPITFRL